MTMIVEFDPAAQATYVSLGSDEVVRTHTLSDLVMVDLNREMEPIGVEFVVPPDKITDDMILRVVNAYPTLKHDLYEDRSWLFAKS